MSQTLINELINATDGEKSFVRLIDNLQDENPEYDFQLYYEPEGYDKFPDFVLYSPYFGITFFEIKDYSIESVNTFDLQHMKVNRKEGLLTFRFHRPSVVLDYIDEFKQIGQSIPVSILYVFPNISELDIQQKFNFDIDRIDNPFIYKDDFIDFDVFINKIKSHRKFTYKETEKSKIVAINRITRQSPKSIITRNKNGILEPGLFENLNSEDNIFVLDKQQQITLNKFMSKQGYRFLKGHAGTGKTVLIISRAEFLANTFINSKILITYYTSQLDGVFHHLMNKYPGQITAQRMGQFCNSHLQPNQEVKQDIQYWEKYYSQCINIISSNNHKYNGYFDFIFVDEGQDFTFELGVIIEHLAKGNDFKNKNVLIAFDDFQALNTANKVDTTDTFKGKQRGRVKKLEIAYRTTEQIAEKASKLINENIVSTRSNKDSFKIKYFKSNQDIITFIQKAINKALNNQTLKIELRDIAIIYPHLGMLHQKTKNLIKESNLTTPIQYYNKRISKSIMMEHNTVKVLSSTYSKGLDFKIVFLIYFEELSEQGKEVTNKKAREHLYVSMTRAKEYLFVLSIKHTPILDIIDEN